VNFVAGHVTKTELPGMQNIINVMKEQGVTTPAQLIDASLEALGYLELGDETRSQLQEFSQAEGDLDWSTEAGSASRIGEMMALIGATTEYQFG
jgi:hypothetical protein